MAEEQNSSSDSVSDYVALSKKIIGSIHHTEIEPEYWERLREISDILDDVLPPERTFKYSKPDQDVLWNWYSADKSTSISEVIEKNQKSTVPDAVREKRDEMYKHFRDNVGAIDVGMAADALRSRLIDPMTVDDWVQSEAIDGLVLPYEAIEEGYPEYAGQFEQHKAKRLADAQDEFYDLLSHIANE